MRIFLLLTFLTSLACTAHAQTEVVTSAPVPSAPKDTSYWRKGSQLGFNLSQASFSKNWKSGGTNNISFAALARAKAEYIRGRASWRSELDFQYGGVQNQGQGFRKSQDKIFIDSKYGHNFSKNWSFYGSLNFFSQFAHGFKYSTDPNGQVLAKYVSNFMSPGYFTESIGVEYKPADYFFVRMGTGTLRQTVVQDTTLHNQEPTNYGVHVGKKVRNEIAFQAMASFERDIAKNLTLKARYTGFYNYTTIADPRNWDHRIETSFVAKINRYVSTSLSAIMIYDRDADRDVQVSYQLGFGLLATIGAVDK